MIEDKYVYLIQSIEDSKLKIGYSKSPQNRIKSLSTGNGNTLKLLETYKTQFYSQVEIGLHNRFSYQHKMGEWYDYDIEIIEKFNYLCKTYERGVFFLKNNHNKFI